MAGGAARHSYSGGASPVDFGYCLALNAFPCVSPPCQVLVTKKAIKDVQSAAERVLKTYTRYLKSFEGSKELTAAAGQAHGNVWRIPDDNMWREAVELSEYGTGKKRKKPVMKSLKGFFGKSRRDDDDAVIAEEAVATTAADETQAKDAWVKYEAALVDMQRNLLHINRQLVNTEKQRQQLFQDCLRQYVVFESSKLANQQVWPRKVAVAVFVVLRRGALQCSTTFKC